MSGRIRPLTKDAAEKIVAYMEEQAQELGLAGKEKYHVTESYDVRLVDKLTPEDVQKVSSGQGAVFILDSNADKEKGAWCQYSSENPYEVVRKDHGKNPEPVYLDEIYEKAMQSQMSKEKTVQQEKAPQQESKPQAEHSSRSMMLVGVSKKAVRHREDASGERWVNVAVPWKQAKNGLGHLDISEDEFGRANTPEDLKKRQTLHIPLSRPEYGLWYVDKETGKPTKPTVSAGDIKVAYEENREAYRKSKEQQATAPEPVAEEKGKTSDRPLPKVAENMAQPTGPDFGDDMDL